MSIFFPGEGAVVRDCWSKSEWAWSHWDCLPGLPCEVMDGLAFSLHRRMKTFIHTEPIQFGKKKSFISLQGTGKYGQHRFMLKVRLIRHIN